MENWEKNHSSGENSRGCIGTEQSGTGTEQSGTGTEQSGTGTDCVLPLVLYFDQCSYFDHNLVIFYTI